jgi:hypothetical protein
VQPSTHKISLSFAKKLQQLLNGEQLPASSFKAADVKSMMDDGVLQKRVSGKSKAHYFIHNKAAFQHYLFNHFGVADIHQYILTLEDEDVNRAALVLAAGDSKLKAVRTFKGFLVNSYQPIHCSLQHQPFIVQPVRGTFHFIHDYETFVPAADVTIIGVENSENFALIHQQQHLFKHIQPLFLSRYSQTKDIIRWLAKIPNQYLHFGDWDFEGINIYLHEYHQHLHERASFFIPPNIDELIIRYGNRQLYDKQLANAPATEKVTDASLQSLIALFHQHKKVLEQEVLIQQLMDVGLTNSEGIEHE